MKKLCCALIIVLIVALTSNNYVIRDDYNDSKPQTNPLSICCNTERGV